MLIDWFTVGAQVLNFVVLVGLLKHFLYQPILSAIDGREKGIAAKLADAQAKEAAAKKAGEEFQHKSDEFDRQRASLLAKATDEAKAEGQRLLDEARKAADVLSAQRQAKLRTDAQSLDQALAHLARQEVFAIARKALADLATASLEERLGEVFTRRLRELDDKAKAGLGWALKKSADPALVRSAFELPAGPRAAIQNALNETFATEVRLRFEIAPELVCGIELSANGEKLAWSIADYLTALSKGVDALVAPRSQPEPAPAAKTEPAAKAA
jgi:F-type H+-transporting ATPase subunit b